MELDPELKAVFDQTAAAVGRPKWFVLQQMLLRLESELGPDGRPEWWSDDFDGQEELPLTQSA